MKLKSAFECMGFTNLVFIWMLLCVSANAKESNFVRNEKKGLYLSEIMPFWEGTPSNVWVEVYNSSVNDINLSQWRLEDSSGVGFSFHKTAGNIHSNGVVVVFFGKEEDAPPSSLREGKWFFTPPFEKEKLFLTNNVKKCNLIFLSDTKRTITDSVSWSQPCTTSLSAKILRDAFAREDKEAILAAKELIIVGPAQLDVNCTLGRVFMDDESEHHLRWDVFLPSATSPGRRNHFPPPNRVIGPSDGKRISHHTQLKISWASIFPVSMQIAKDSDFKNKILEKNNIDFVPFKISEHIKLGSGTYYWRIRGKRKNKTDITLQSPWSDVRSFTIE